MSTFKKAVGGFTKGDDDETEKKISSGQKERNVYQMVDMLSDRLKMLSDLVDRRNYGLSEDVNAHSSFRSSMVEKVHAPEERVSQQRTGKFSLHGNTTSHAITYERLFGDETLTSSKTKGGLQAVGIENKRQSAARKRNELRRAHRAEIEKTLQTNLESFVARSVESVIYQMDQPEPIEVDAKLLLSYAAERMTLLPTVERMFKHFAMSQLSVSVFSDVFWFVHCKFFQEASEDAQEHLLERVAAKYVALLSKLKKHKDYFFKFYPYATASAVCWGFHYLFPGSRHLYHVTFKRKVYLQCAQLLNGMRICPISVQVTRHQLFPDEVADDLDGEPVEHENNDMTGGAAHPMFVPGGGFAAAPAPGTAPGSAGGGVKMPPIGSRGSSRGSGGGGVGSARGARRAGSRGMGGAGAASAPSLRVNNNSSSRGGGHTGMAGAASTPGLLLLAGGAGRGSRGASRRRGSGGSSGRGWGFYESEEGETEYGDEDSYYGGGARRRREEQEEEELGPGGIYFDGVTPLSRYTREAVTLNSYPAERPLPRQKREPFNASQVSPMVQQYLKHPHCNAGRQGYALRRTTPVPWCHVGGKDTHRTIKLEGFSRDRESALAELQAHKLQAEREVLQSKTVLNQEVRAIQDDYERVVNLESDLSRFCLDLVEGVEARGKAKARGQPVQPHALTLQSHASVRRQERQAKATAIARYFLDVTSKALVRRKERESKLQLLAVENSGLEGGALGASLLSAASAASAASASATASLASPTAASNATPPQPPRGRRGSKTLNQGTGSGLRQKAGADAMVLEAADLVEVLEKKMEQDNNSRLPLV